LVTTFRSISEMATSSSSRTLASRTFIPNNSSSRMRSRVRQVHRPPISSAAIPMSIPNHC
jgi:hypothetical protein